MKGNLRNIIVAATATLLVAIQPSTVPVAAADGAQGSGDADTIAGPLATSESIPWSKLGPVLLALYREYREYMLGAEQESGASERFQSKDTSIRVEHGTVAIDAVATDDASLLRADLERLGMEGPSLFGRMVSGLFPVARLEDLSGLPSLRFAYPSLSYTNAGSVSSQGDAAVRANVARAVHGVDGSGVTIGIISDSYDCRGGAAAGVASGNLPVGIEVFEESDCTQGIEGRRDEGRAMMEILHDVAPGAKFLFHTRYGGQANFARGILDLVSAGADIIVDDINYLAEPMFQDGIIAQAIDQATAAGVAYFSAAYNYGRNSYEAPFQASGTLLDYGRGACQLHDFDPAPSTIDTFQAITLRKGEETRFSFQWDEPFFSVSGPPGAAHDLDLLLLDAAGTTVVAQGSTANSGADPVEMLAYAPPDNPAVATEYNLAIGKCAGPDPGPGLMKYVVGYTTINEFNTKSPTVYGHANAATAESVGAARYDKTPEFGTSVPQIEVFSSSGGTPILFDRQGTRVAPIYRNHPTIVAPDRVDNTFYGTDTDHNGLPNFTGTSAAAAHAAGIAALLLDANSALPPLHLYNVLETTAIDMDDPATPGFDGGFDFRTGDGLVQADAAIDEATAPADVSIGQSDAPDPVTAGQPLTYTLVVTNSGPNAAGGVTVNDLIPATATLVATAPSQGSCTGTRPISCDLGGLASGASATVGVTVTPRTAIAVTNAATVSAIQLDPVPANNSASETTVVAPVPGAVDLSLTMSDSPDPLAGGQPLSYTLTVTNHGPDTAQGVAITDALPGTVNFVSASPSQGECLDSDTVTCNLGGLGVGGSATVTLVVSPRSAGTLTNTASVASDKADPSPANNTASAITTVTAPLCFGRPATIFGTDGNDLIFGTDGNDVIAALGGDDSINGLGGHDRICGGEGADTVIGGSGNDRLSGGAGPDKLYGGQGRDRISGGSGNDRLSGGTGKDRLSGGRGKDRLDGGPSVDTLRGGSGRDLCRNGERQQACDA